MKSLSIRLAKLEQAKSKVSTRAMSDMELAVRADYMISTQAPGWEKLAKLLGLPVKEIETREIKCPT